MSSKKKVEKLGYDEAKNVVIEYMEKEYRPYSVTDLVLNLHNRIPKALMIKILDDLVDENLMIVKRYGKLAYYCNVERKLDENIIPISLEQLKELSSEIEIIDKDVSQYKGEITKLKNELTDDELKNTVENLRKIQNELNERLEGLMKIQNTPKDTDTDSRFREIEVNESNHLRQYKKMKKIHTEIVNTLKEGVPNFKEQMESLGVETIPNILL
ncbi:Hop2 protein [Pichia kluyveri]|uniref:Hop2 protein n=1 Tax=Pichia kluyveri TaxID=36015 RepID=A0AAV5R3Q1_PICKL|nr:Hop2 protein [Pichia kluyveri]